jgi:hypothetical protein
MKAESPLDRVGPLFAGPNNSIVKHTRSSHTASSHQTKAEDQQHLLENTLLPNQLWIFLTFFVDVLSGSSKTPRPHENPPLLEDARSSEHVC